MTIKQIYELAIKLGIQNDLRGAEVVRKRLKREKELFNKLSDKEKKDFDKENLVNPFADSRMFTDNPNKTVTRIMVGIDIGTEELLLAKELSKDKPIDLVLAHHPIGPALAGLHEVMHLQAEIMEKYGVPINVAENLTNIRLEEVARSVSSSNHNRVLDAAKLLGFDMMCTHTTADNMVATYLDKYLKRNKDKVERVDDILELLEKIPEYNLAMVQKTGPKLFSGTKDNFAGKIALTEVTGGTSGSKEMYEKLSQAGVGTIIGMHMHEEHKVEAEKNHINVIIAGHMSSDSIGMNLFLDELEKRGIEIIPCSGLVRVKRYKKAQRLVMKKKDKKLKQTIKK
ncbi:MAG: NGG1p interacting factor NIF3 [bacterium]|nr:NGG1p interacting factor NIF3 [bacterium]